MEKLLPLNKLFIFQVTCCRSKWGWHRGDGFTTETKFWTFWFPVKFSGEMGEMSDNFYDRT